MKFPRCIRLDASDTYVYARAATPGEWAVPGGLSFTGRDPEALDTKSKRAFQNGWLGTESFGWSTLVEVAEITEAEFSEVVERLARHFVAAHGAPDLAAARPVARAEADYAAGLCEHKAHTLLALERGLRGEGAGEGPREEPGEGAGGEDIVERFRVIVPGRAKDHASIWEIVPDDEPPA